MPVTSPISLSKIAGEFGGEARASRFLRGGVVPNTAANQNVSTTANGWRMSTFLNASNVSLNFREDQPTYQWSGTQLTSTFDYTTAMLPTGGSGAYSWTVANGSITGDAQLSSVIHVAGTDSVRWRGSVSNGDVGIPVSAQASADITVSNNGNVYTRRFSILLRYTRNSGGVGGVSTIIR